MAIELNLCPVCNGKMVSRQNKSTGQRFWGCADYPKCKGTRNTDGEAPRAYDRDVESDTRLPSERRTDKGWGR